MKSILTIIFIFLLSSSMQLPQGELSENRKDFKSGEFLKYRVHYMGVTAGYATLDLSSESYNSTTHYHAVGKGWTSGVSKIFFKVDDLYETYINESDRYPSKFIRKINEGGYTKDKEIQFNQNSKNVTVKDNEKNTTKTYRVEGKVQDMLSAFYYLRKYNASDLKNGTHIQFKIFMDDETFLFKVKVLAHETIDSDFGKIKTIKVRPYVQSGRVFKEKESLTFWISDDNNLVPILIKADLAVGSLKAELTEYKNLKYNINFF